MSNVKTGLGKKNVHHFWRNKSTFTIENGKLIYDGRYVLQASSIKYVIRKRFTKVVCCGARLLSTKLIKRYSGLSERQVLREYSISKYYYQAYRIKSLPKTVTAKRKMANRSHGHEK